MADDRDFVGYGANPPDPQWPGRARIAVNINLNFEGGGERSVMEGDGVSEGVLNDMGMSSLPGVRSPIVESAFEYGSRVGGWRLLRLFLRFGVKICLLAVAKAAGWMTGRPSANTRRLPLELGGFLCDRDSLGDELPYRITIGATRHLTIPYSFETNDNRFDQNLGFSTGEDFACYMIDCFEVMYEEGAEHAKLMSLALHDRLTGRPGRITGLVKFFDHITARDRVWICTGREIAEHWRRAHPDKSVGPAVSAVSLREIRYLIAA
jgi:hypothetical protein